MMVETTSCTLKTAFKSPGKKPQRAPPATAAAIKSGSKSGRGRVEYRAIKVTQRPPISICPEAPILKSPVLNAKLTARPTNKSVVAVASVFPSRSMLIRPPRNK